MFILNGDAKMKENKKLKDAGDQIQELWPKLQVPYSGKIWWGL